MRFKNQLLSGFILLVSLCQSCISFSGKDYGRITCKGVAPQAIGQDLSFVDDTTAVLVTSDLSRRDISLLVSKDGGKNWTSGPALDSAWSYCASIHRNQTLYLALYRQDSVQCSVLEWKVPDNQVRWLQVGTTPVYRNGMWFSDNEIIVLVNSGVGYEADLLSLDTASPEVRYVRHLHNRVSTLNMVGSGYVVSDSREDGIILDGPEEYLRLQKGVCLRPFDIRGEHVIMSEALSFQASSSSPFLQSWNTRTGEVDTLYCFKGYDEVRLFYAEDNLFVGYVMKQSGGFPGKDVAYSSDGGHQWTIREMDAFGQVCECVYKDRLFVYQDGYLRWFSISNQR